MAWSGGNYTKGNNATGGWVGDASLGIGIEAGRHDTQDDDFATGINQCLNKDGSNPATGNLNLGGFKYTNAAAATARTELARVDQVQDGDFIWLGTTGGTATAQTATATPAITAYKAGQKFRMLVGSGLGSTGAGATAHTLNINAIGTKQIVSNDGLNSSPTIGSWVAGAILELVYDGTYMRIANDPSGWLDYTITTTNLTGEAPNIVSSITTSNTRFRKINKTVFLEMNVQINLGTGGNPRLNLTSPVNASSSISSTNMFFLPGLCLDATATTIGFGYFSSATNFVISKNVLVNTNWTAGTGTYIRLNFNYESV
jgi:hypothetical protein